MIQNTTNKTGTAIGKGCGVLFFSVFALMGGFFMFMIGQSIRADWKTRDWVPTEAVLLAPSSTLEMEHNEKKNAESIPFRYGYEGRTYTRDSVTLENTMAMNGRKSDSYRRLRSMPVGTKVKCFVNPQKPEEAVLEQRSLIYAWFLLLPAVFILVGVGGIIGMILMKPEHLKPKSKRFPNGGRGGVIGLRIFGIVFMLAGGLGTYFMTVKPMLAAWAAESWIQVPCKIDSATIKTHHDNDSGATYSIEVRYSYEIDGRKYTGDRYSFHAGSSSSRGWRDAAVKALRANRAPVCYVNPADPLDTVISRDLGSDKWFGLIPLVFFVIGLAIFLGARKMAAKTGTARGLPIPLPSQQRIVSLAQGGFELRPITTPKAGCLGTGIIALFWNGVVWTIFLQAELPTVARIFLLIFVLIGLALAGGCVYFLLAMLNPKATLTADAGAVQLGKSLRLKWKLTGNTSRISQFTVSLIAKETATYQRGTNTTTDHSLFVNQQIFETRDRAAITTGEIIITIPADSMHSFEAPNNKIVWIVKLHGDIAKWPDVNLEYPITVLPHTAL